MELIDDVGVEGRENAEQVCGIVKDAYQTVEHNIM